MSVYRQWVKFDKMPQINGFCQANLKPKTNTKDKQN